MTMIMSIYKNYVMPVQMRSRKLDRLITETISLFPSLWRKIGTNSETFKVLKWGRDVWLSDGQSTLVLNSPFAHLLLTEVDSWNTCYPLDVKGKTVLDIGAGTGETAWFFFKHGAKRVIAVEPDPKRIKYLQRNKRMNNWEMEIIAGVFDKSQLELNYQIVKIDCEGGEKLLLDPSIKSLKPCMIEMHHAAIGKDKCTRIQNKFGLQRIVGSDLSKWTYCVMSNETKTVRPTHEITFDGEGYQCRCGVWANREYAAKIHCPEYKGESK